MILFALTSQEPRPPDGQYTDCTGDYAPGVVLVGFQPHLQSISRLESIWDRSKNHLPPPHQILSRETGTIQTVPVPIGYECAALAEFRRDPRVTFAELDYAVHAIENRSMIPNDPAWPHQWGTAKINALAAWDVTTGTPDVIVAVLDTGIKLGHEDLADNVWSNPGEVPGNGWDDDGNGQVDDVHGWHFYHAWDGRAYLPGADNQVADDHGHGTHATGIAGAQVHNALGVAGMAGNIRLMAVKVLDEQGDGWYSDLAQGIIYAVDNGAQIINLSVGGTDASQTLQGAVDYAYEQGVLVVAAVGNGGGSVLYPAACERVLAVSATDYHDAFWPQSKHGPQVDIAAPGVSIYSTGWPGDRYTNCTDGYCYKSGTSMATPYVSGLAALIWSARPNLTVGQVSEIITATARDANADTLPGRDEYLGWGRIQADRALSASVQVGNIDLTASHYLVSAGEKAVIAATVPPMTGTANVFSFSSSHGFISPSLTILSDDVTTTTLTTGPKAGLTIVTGTSGVFTGNLFLRILPGTVVSTSLIPASTLLQPGRSIIVTVTATDKFGNSPLNDGTSVSWSASAGSVWPTRSPLIQGASEATFNAGFITPIIITAELSTGIITTTTVNVNVHQLYLPTITRDRGA